MFKSKSQSYHVFMNIFPCPFAGLDCVIWKDKPPPPTITKNPHLERVEMFLSKCNGVEIRGLTIKQTITLIVTPNILSA